MEGQRILAALKGKQSWEETYKDSKNYLAPVVSKASNPETSHYGKYELFSLKLFKLVIELLAKCKAQQKCETLRNIGVLCIESLQVCDHCSGKAPPLSFEKMLLHFIKCCFTLEELETAEMSCRVLYTQLAGYKGKTVAEVQTLFKHAFDMLWKSSLLTEQKLGFSARENCLELQELAFKCLLSSGDFELALLIERIIKTDVHFHKLCTNESPNQSTDRCTNREQAYNRLYSFHTSLLQHKDFISLVRADMLCITFSTSMMYMLHLVHLYTKTGHRKEAQSCLKLALELYNDHSACCHERMHVYVSAQAHCLQLWSTLAETNEWFGNSHPVSSSCQALAASMEDVTSTEASAHATPFLQRLIEYLEIIVTHLKERREAFISQTDGNDEDLSVAFVHQKTFEPLKSVLLNSVECLEMFLKAQLPSFSTPNLEQSARSRQLYLLSFLTDVLVDLLNCDDDDEIEIMRSSSTVVAPPPHSQPGHPKQELAESCLPLIKNSQQIITKATTGVLPSSEHKWLGNDAYRLYQALYHCKLYGEASEVLRVSCEELTYWCRESDSEEQQLKRALESHLLERFVRLCEANRMDSNYSNATKAIENALVSLPVSQIATEDCAASLVSQWVKMKRDIIKEGVFSCEDTMVQQSILQALQQVKGVTDDTKILYLETELKLYKTHSRPMHPCEKVVIRNLLDLYSHGDSEVNRARLTIELASISRQCASLDDTSGSPITLLDEAIALLEPLTTHTGSPSTTVTQSYQHLATAYLWKAICNWEDHMNSCGQSPSPLPQVSEPSSSKPASDEREKEAELCLSQDEEHVLMSDDVLQCLYSAVEGWEGLWRVVTESNTSVTSSTSCFHNSASLFHHIYLTSSLCLAHSQPVLALKSLCVMLDIYNWFTTPPSELQAPYQKALALYHQLLISFADQELDTQPLELTVSSSKPESAEVLKKEQSEFRESLLHCKLVLAEWYLSRGQKDSCHALLVDVLSDSLHEKSSTMSFFVVAKAKLLASEYLQRRDFEIMSSSDFLQYLRNESDTTPTDCMESFRLSPLEVVVDSVKIFRQLADHRHARSTREEDDQGDNEESVEKQSSACGSDGDHFDEAFVIDDSINQPSSSSSSLPAEKHSPSNNKGVNLSTTTSDRKQPASVSHVISPVVSAWEILVSLLSTLKRVARLYLLQGNIKQAYYYAKEGTMLARTMLLQGWYLEFCILLCEIHLTRGRVDCSLVFINQTAKLLECEDYCKSVITSIENQVKSTSSTGGDEGTEVPAETVIILDESDSVQSDDSDDSFLSEMVASVRTPPLSRAGAAQTTDHVLNAHPSVCKCPMCVCHVSLLQNVKLALLVCELATQIAVVESQGNDDVIPDTNTSAETILKVLSDASELLNSRIPKCNSVLKSIVVQSKAKVHSRPKSKSKLQRPTKSKRSNETSPRTSNEPSPQPSLDITRSSSYFCVSADLTKLIADMHLLLLQPEKAIIVTEGALNDGKTARTETFSNEKLSLLHYTLGIARVQELEISHPELAKSLWEAGPFSKIKSKAKVAVDPENDPYQANVQRVGDDVPEEAVLVTRRPRRGKKTVSKTKPGSNTQKQPSSKSKVPTQLSKAATDVIEHFIVAYQLCYPSMPALLLRDISRWLALLLSNDSSEIAGHFLTLSMNITLTHQTIYSLGKKIKNYQNVETKSPFYHAQEALHSLTCSSSHFKSQSSSFISTIKARHLLQSTGTPPSLSYTKKLLTSLTPQWSMCTICLAPKTNPTRPTFLLLSRTMCGGRTKLGSNDCDADESPTVQVQKSSRTKTSRKVSKDICIDVCTTKKMKENDTYPSSVLVKIPTNGFSFLRQCDDIHRAAAESVSLKEKTEWWVARRSLDTKMKELLLQLELDCLGDSADLFNEGDTRTVILVLGQHVHRLPWECLSTLKGLTVTRMPSLPFASAHKTLVGYNDSVTVNPNSAYYVLNPHGDLLKTEKLFSSWFANNVGWDGVVGKSPSHDQFATALQDRDLYVYCGHSAGKFLDTNGFHLLHCQATALLLGCSSGKLVASGKCDPSGIALSYLMAGCPSLVGCLWDVTDGEIDRFCKALLESILEHNKKGKSTQRTHHQSSKTLSAHVSNSRTACKLHWLVGAAPVVYGLPVTTKPIPI